MEAVVRDLSYAWRCEMAANRDTLLAYLVPMVTPQVEDAATYALVYILNKSESARKAFNTLIETVIPVPVEECIVFKAQITEADSRFDFVGYGQGDEKIVIGEAKRDAELGHGQGGGYLSQLPESPSVLLFVVPDHRIEYLWGRVKNDVLTWDGGAIELEPIVETHDRVRCSKVQDSNQYLMMVSWRNLLERIHERTREEQQVRSDVHQLQGLAEVMDMEVFEPIKEEELSRSFPQRMLGLIRLVGDALERGQQQQWIGPLGSRWSSSQGNSSAGWYLRISEASVPAWFGVYHDLWAREDCVDSPLWVNLFESDPTLVNTLAGSLGLQAVDESYLPVRLKANASYDEVLDDVVNQLNAIKAAIEETGSED